MPAYVLATREDHIVPWQTAYASTRLLGGKIEFVLAASGHIAGVINPPYAQQAQLLVNDAARRRMPKPGSPAQPTHAGQLVDALDRWLAQHGGDAGRRRARPLGQRGTTR